MKRVVMLLLAILGSASCGDQYDPSHAVYEPHVFGIIRDARTKDPIPWVDVTVDGVAGGTNSTGQYSIELDSDGDFSVTAKKEGYEDFVGEVRVRGWTSYDIEMEAVAD